ncbi:hypothetical protein PPERSA_04672 [Pseudocohnilembus persalinus]|uniref:Uncharacterized protein n=1 Tax=Pseudocohnilembus persalinus TaxID=266149 RepID=A0A0V0R4F8_PSEPJ|nr:hypothetical protein PPERSA_04672 [Pseudocohnilembus persalinus]|eukprot:KRX09366.1 hypothetical protein PPERSA_04672 [Pseudocohnilembus persalinus]
MIQKDENDSFLNSNSNTQQQKSDDSFDEEIDKQIDSMFQFPQQLKDQIDKRQILRESVNNLDAFYILASLKEKKMENFLKCIFICSDNVYNDIQYLKNEIANNYSLQKLVGEQLDRDIQNL